MCDYKHLLKQPRGEILLQQLEDYTCCVVISNGPKLFVPKKARFPPGGKKGASISPHPWGENCKVKIGGIVKVFAILMCFLRFSRDLFWRKNFEPQFF